MEFKTADTLRRGVAFLIDILLSILLVQLTFSIIGLFIPLDKQLGSLDYMVILAIIIFVPAFYLVGVPYFFDNTVGKYLARIRVISADTKLVPTLKQLFQRWLLLILWPVEIIAVLISHEQHRMGDNFTNTRVVMDFRNTTSWYLRTSLTVVILAIMVVTPIFTILLASTNMLLYKTAIKSIRESGFGNRTLGAPVTLNFLPYSVRKDGNQGYIILQAKGSKKSGFIALTLERNKKYEWTLTKAQVTDKPEE